jgi:hypothetical protein
MISVLLNVILLQVGVSRFLCAFFAIFKLAPISHSGVFSKAKASLKHQKCNAKCTLRANVNIGH